MIAGRGKATGIYAAGWPMCWVKPGPKTRSGRKPARGSVSRTWRKSANDSAKSTGISGGNCAQKYRRSLRKNSLGCAGALEKYLDRKSCIVSDLLTIDYDSWTMAEV